MEEDTLEDVRQYLARDENKAKVQFTASLEGRTSDELMTLLKTRKDSDIDDKCLDDGTTNSSSNHQGKDVAMQSEKSYQLSRAQQEEEEDVESTVMGTEKVVEICTVEASRDELLSQVSENERFPKKQEEHSGAWRAVYSGELVTKEELEEVRREMLMQESLVKALEKDNVNLHEERRALRAKLNEMEKKAVNVEAKYSILASGQSPNHGSVRQASSVPMMSWQGEQQVSQDEVSIELERQRTVVRELQLELELIRREKKDIEKRLASLDAKKFEEMELELRNLRVDLKRKETDHNETVKDMARKIAWYVEHQEFNHSQEELLKEQQDIIRRLRARLHEVGALDGEGKKMPVSKKDTHVRNLTKRIVELEEALNSKYPNSIAQLIRSCQPSVQDSKLFKQLNLKIKELENALAEKDRCAEAAVTRLRVETDRMRIQYQERIEKLEEELKLRLLHAQTRRVRELEKQLSEARQALREKEKEKNPPVSADLVTSCDNDYVREKKIESSSSSASPLGEVKKPATATSIGVINRPDETISQLQEENEALRNELYRVTHETAKNTPIIPSSSSPLHLQSQSPQDDGIGVSSSHLISSMQAQINTLTAEQTIYKRLLMESQESLRDAHARWDERLLMARQEYQLQIQRIRQEHNDEIARIQEHHQRELHSIVEQNRSAEEASKVCEKIFQISSNDSKHNQTFLQSVAERLAYLERRQEQKEREAAHEIAEVKRVADFELSLMKQKAEMMIEQKNHQIHEFRLQLDHLLSSLALLQTYA
ncbi:viral A-type inclusion protein [Trypanosoma theileri]|uniref:Centrosomal protein of 162 kDa n=1 Tax=Trypanosoma theileri TaxID=67003 RepID=A0A1X0NWV0_9TRYP|nr:viral A-type inclusion protein [Trypanosoma theileri]ORC89187.1 viral A-type inclusion protein [Trypanosoma theileri]